MQNQQDELIDEVLSQRRTFQRLESEVDATAQTIRSVQAPNIMALNLDGTESQPDSRGRVLMDPSTHEARFYASDLPPLNADHTDQLSFITSDERKLPAGTFTTDAAGRGTLITELPTDIGLLVVAAVTDEPAGGSLQPTGSIRLVVNILRCCGC